jgi:hypothetical protein
MGCFSYMCQVCDKPIRSDSERGQPATLFLLRNGRILEAMEGEYDSYGRVFDENGESIHWDYDWSKAVELHFSRDLGNGIAAFHRHCFKRINRLPETRSMDDPDQGWGSFRLQTTPFKGGKKIDIAKTFPEIIEINKSTPEEKVFLKVFEHMKQKFKSGNEIPVTMTTITRKEWDVIFPILQKYYMDTLFMPMEKS